MLKYEIINGIKIYAPENSVDLVSYAIENKKILIAINAEKILNADNETREIINKNIGYPDGIGAVLALKKKGLNNSIKIAGCELWLEIIKLNFSVKTFYLIGGKVDVIEKTVKKLKTNFPNINIVNYRDGYINSKKEEIALLDDVKDKKPDIIFVAMGSPKQEFLMKKLNEIHNAVYQGLGGSFDVYINNVKRAPRWWVNNNLEWTYRLLKQPSRIKRQFPLIKFLWNLTLNKY